MSASHRIALAGAGGIAGTHAAAIAGIPGATLVSACSRNAENVAAFCREHGGRPHTDLGRMLDEERPDVLCVTTPSGAHLEPVLAAAERGIHVFCEKPLEVSAARMGAMIEACDRHGVRLGAVFQQRRAPLLREVHAAACAGRFGPRPLIQATVPWWRDDAYYAQSPWRGTWQLDGGGALMNQSIHAVDALLWLAAATTGDPTRQPVARVSAFVSVQGRDAALLEVEDTCVLNLQMRDGRLAQLLATTAARPGQGRRLLMAGRGGSAEIVENRLVGWSFPDADADTDLARHDEGLRQRFGADPANEDGPAPGAGDPLGLRADGHRELLVEFLADVDAGREPALGGRAGRQAVDVVLAAYASAERGGEPVEL